MEQVKRVLFIQIGAGFFAIEITQVKRFIDKAKISEIPAFGDKGAIPSICGMIYLDNEVIPVLDIYRWFGQKPMQFDEKTIFVVKMSSGKSFAVPINAVIKSCDVSSKYFHAVPAILKQENVGVFKEVIDSDGTLYPKIDAETI